MIDREQWGYNPEWEKYVLWKWQGRGRVEQVHDDSIAPFRDRARQAFSDRGFPVKKLKTWINVMIQKEGDGYDEGYPHVHYPLTGLTLVHYLYPGDPPALLDIFEGDDIIETVTPEQGLTVFMPNDLKHGVRKYTGQKPRVCMIATALR